MRQRLRVRQAGPLRVVEVAHPAVAACVARLRDRTLSAEGFRRDLLLLGRDLAYEAVTAGSLPAVVVPVLRAGLGFLPGALDVLPQADCGFLGLRRGREAGRAGRWTPTSGSPSRGPTC